MSDILHDFPISAPVSQVFDAVSTPSGLDRWWTLTSAGEARADSVFRLGFGPEYDWRAQVSRCEKDRAFELEITSASPDWVGTRVSFDLQPTESGTQVRFAHRGWPDESDHYRTSSFCWAMYLRLLSRALEFGEFVPYDDRLRA
jgi:uncharacterized protein YndB with AHSA1/START domain